MCAYLLPSSNKTYLVCFFGFMNYEFVFDYDVPPDTILILAGPIPVKSCFT